MQGPVILAPNSHWNRLNRVIFGKEEFGCTSYIISEILGYSYLHVWVFIDIKMQDKAL